MISLDLKKIDLINKPNQLRTRIMISREREEY